MQIFSTPSCSTDLSLKAKHYPINTEHLSQRVVVYKGLLENRINVKY